MKVSSWLANSSFNISMDLAQFRIYNRALTVAEALQNYTATKKRYGL